ncbi:MAG TPA: UDP-N-acetylmuramoyl-L-alanyl-D-glutamate--2,6-diaminopimelate ligase [Candidatus Nitrosotenuis sp.]|jgi:UDP-N-acetylmuramoyl-L-alanyl-D-glutamate--2,6-diaminopimelate ligase|nr:UDP-N-acetylmuramoyl-L-alanyl-D-glutamate--2,6-diaminopimelate ligase [Candidatus Nitrosotenuis sp.]
MKLADLARCLEDARLEGDPDVEVKELAYDSREVGPGCLFVCIEGFSTDGHLFAPSALARGAAALVCERDIPGTEGVPRIRVPNTRRALALLSAEMTGRPADHLLTVGITGTNGKTTTAFLTEAVLRARGNRPGLLGTIQAQVGGQVRRLANTTPESLDLHRLFAEMRQARQDSVVMEVSSHALALDRVYGIPYDVGVFTNLSQDHLDFHGDMESYFQAKLRLFHSLGTVRGRPVTPYAVVNIDDEYGRRVLEVLRVPFVTYGFSEEAHVRATEVDVGPDGLGYLLITPLGQSRVDLQLSGLFNVYNSLAAISVGLALRVDLEPAVRAVESVEAVPGRFQLVSEGQDFAVVVDYAHTPAGLASLLRSVREITPGRVVAVYGCGGDRDRSKRPQMGRIGGELADFVVLTSDNPRSEDPMAILAQVEGGLKASGCPYAIQPDREVAISLALHSARPGDTVVIAGKGHETYQIFKDRTIPFDDVEVARRILRERPFPEQGKSQRRMPVRWNERRRVLPGLLRGSRR